MATNDARRCAEPYAWLRADRASGEAAEARRRIELRAFWIANGKFHTLTTPPRAVRSPPGLQPAPPLPRHHPQPGLQPAALGPCALRFGGRPSHAEGRVESCRYFFPDGQRTAESAHKDCYAWCEGTLSATNARASLVHSRIPLPLQPSRRQLGPASNCSIAGAVGCQP